MNSKIPDEIKKARGTYRADRREKSTYLPADETKPRRPPELEGHAKRFWDKNMPRLWEQMTISRRHVPSFILLCETYDLMESSREYCDEHGFVEKYFTKYGERSRIRPEYTIFRQQQAEYFRLSSEFGLSPIASKRLPAKKRSPGTGSKLSIIDFVNEPSPTRKPSAEEAGKLKPPKAKPTAKGKK